VRLYLIALGVVLCAGLTEASPALALSIGIAAKCDALTNKAYPHRVAGNPAAGLRNGSAADARKYFNTCVKEAERREREQSQAIGQAPAK
jgi:hypothetical protein